MKIEENKPCFKVFFGLCIVLVAVLIAYVVVAVWNGAKEGKYIGRDIEQQSTISVSATGEVYVKPDLGVMSFSVVTEKETVESALAENTEKMNKVISEIKNQGVEEKDLKTTSFNIYPRYEYKREQTLLPSGERVLAGYEVIQRIEVKIRDLEKTGDIVATATEAGANQAGQLRFTVENEDEPRNEARKQAIDKAKEKAELLASQLGVDLAKIKSFSEDISNYPVFWAERGDAVGLGGGSPEIETGENKIETSVTIVYEID